ncbi:MAG: YihY/virulence factor BrkB family protein [Chloroflexota bacterium]
MKHLRTLFSLLKETIQEWNNDKAPRLAAALAYYTAFSIAPLLIVAIAIASAIFSQEAVRGQLDNQIQGVVGMQAADAIQQMIANSSRDSTGVIASVIGVITLLLGAAGLFGQLQDALNTVWGVPPRPNRGIIGTIKDRFISFAMVLGIGFLLLVSLVISTVLSALNGWVTGMLPGAEFLAQLLNFAVSFGVVTLLFAAIYKVLPDTPIEWSDVWIGAAVTALLFTIGKFLLGLYLGNSTIASSYGAAGSFVVLLVWIYYSAQILLLGAEFTQVYARRHGSHNPANPEAVKPEAAKATAVMAGTLKGAVDYQLLQKTMTIDTQLEEKYRDVPDTRPAGRDYVAMILGLAAAAGAFVSGILLGKRNQPE